MSDEDEPHGQGLITYLLPRVGLGVEKIILDGSQCLSGRLIQQALQLCPNVLHISAAYTFFDYYSLKGLHLLGGLRKLKYLDLEGCEYVDDNTLAALAESLRPLSDINPSNQCYSRNCPFLNNSSIAPCLNDPRLCPYNSTVPACAYSSSKFKSVSRGNLTSNEERLMNCSYNDFNNSEIEELYNICDYTNDSSYDLWEQNFRLSNIDNPEPTLEKINLSGCWQVTNSGLLSLLNSYALKNLKSLNLSSCFNLSGEVLLSIASNCDKLRPENLTYCCNISNGPYTSQANGCDSIDHPLKVCCRSLYKS